MECQALGLQEEPPADLALHPGGNDRAGRPLDAKRPAHSASEFPPGQAEQPIKRILVATDFSPDSVRAVEMAVSLARQCAAALIILHVIDISTPPGAGQTTSAAELMQRLWQQGFEQMGRLAFSLTGRVNAQTAVEEGLPWEQIVQKSGGFDLLILGRGGSKASRKLFSQHTAQRVMDNAECPVLLVRAETASKQPWASRCRPSKYENAKNPVSF